MLKIKICGTTNLEDALLAEKLGAELLGFVFYSESPRCISVVRAEKIFSSLSPLTQKVGVFVNESAEKILEVAERLGLDFVQLAGEESEGFVKKIQKRVPVIKVFRVEKGFRVSLLKNSPALLLLADTKVNGFYGGSGKSFDWRELTPFKGDRRLILAGGIGAHNLREAYDTLQPAAVDLTSSVEARHGEKDTSKMEEFFEVANEIRLGR